MVDKKKVETCHDCIHNLFGQAKDCQLDYRAFYSDGSTWHEHAKMGQLKSIEIGCFEFKKIKTNSQE